MPDLTYLKQVLEQLIKVTQKESAKQKLQEQIGLLDNLIPAKRLLKVLGSYECPVSLADVEYYKSEATTYKTLNKEYLQRYLSAVKLKDTNELELLKAEIGIAILDISEVYYKADSDYRKAEYSVEKSILPKKIKKFRSQGLSQKLSEEQAKSDTTYIVFRTMISEFMTTKLYLQAILESLQSLRKDVMQSVSYQKQINTN